MRKKHPGINTFSDFSTPLKIITIIIICGASIFAGIIIFCARFDIALTQGAIEVNSVFAPSVTVPYNEILSVKLEDDPPAGSRTNGYGSFSLSMGKFKNDLYGNYRRYTYASCNEAIILNTAQGAIVINQKTAEETKSLYSEISKKLAEI